MQVHQNTDIAIPVQGPFLISSVVLNWFDFKTGADVMSRASLPVEGRIGMDCPPSRTHIC